MTKKTKPVTAAKDIREISGRVSRVHVFDYKRGDGSEAQGADVSVTINDGATREYWKLTLLGDDALGIITGSDWDAKQEVYVQNRPPLAKGMLVVANGQYSLEPWQSKKHGLVMTPTLKVLSHYDVKIQVVARRPKIVLPDYTPAIKARGRIT